MTARDTLAALVDAVRAEANCTPMSKRAMSVSMALRLADAELARPASGPTRSEALVSRVRSLCHEATRSGEASPLIVAALELCEEHEIVVEQALRAERTIHEMTKGGAA